jgi:NADH:ubiquinone oxidoreductase subunit
MKKLTWKDYLGRAFSWWSGATWGTMFYTWRKGGFVGEDELGNRYYQAAGPEIDPSVGPRRRWVVYNSDADASKVPAGWRGWLAFTVETPPTEERYQPHAWELPNLPNMTGTAFAYRPRGSMLREDSDRPEATGDYEPWSPDGAPIRREPEGHSPHPGAHRDVAHG